MPSPEQENRWESAVLVPVPEAEEAIAALRRRLDPAGSRVPAHVTVLYPFVPPDLIDDAVLDRLARAVRGVAGFDAQFTRVGWFEEVVAYLAPEPDQPFRELTRRVWQAFPDHPPYRGAHPDTTPHLTVGDGAPPTELRSAADAVRRLLPIRTRVDRLQVMQGGDAGAWRVRAEVPLD
jgi:2'-5' RNA ligase